MVAIKDFLPINHIKLCNTLCKEIDTFMKNEFDHFVKENIVEKISKKKKQKNN